MNSNNISFETALELSLLLQLVYHHIHNTRIKEYVNNLLHKYCKEYEKYDFYYDFKPYNENYLQPLEEQINALNSFKRYYNENIKNKGLGNYKYRNQIENWLIKADRKINK